MAKQLGLLTKLLVCVEGSGPALDISGDIANVDEASVMFASLPWTDIDQMAMDRTIGLGDGSISAKMWYDTVPADNPMQHLPAGPLLVMWCLGNAALPVEGGMAFYLEAETFEYPVKLAGSRELAAAIKATGTLGHPGEFGVLMAMGGGVWGGDETSASNHTAIDGGLRGAGLTISTASIANPTVITTSTPHGLVTGDSVNITGSNSTPSINGDYTVTVTGANTFTIPVNVTGSGSAGTATKTSTNYGASLAALLASLTGTSVTFKIYDSMDGTTYAAVTGATTAALTAAAAASRVSTSRTQTIRRYIRVETSGTFTHAAFWCAAHRAIGPLDCG